MKKILIFFLTIGFSQLVVAQSTGVCGTSSNDQVYMLDQRAIDAENAPLVVQNREDELYVPVVFHSVSENDGSGRVSASSILDQFCKLQEDYVNSNFVFYLKEINEVNNSLLYNSAGTDGAGTADAISDNYDAVNIFITENADNNGNSVGTVLGFYTPQGDHIILRKAEVAPPSSTLSHEAGHFFSLAHPHLGWECEPYDQATHGNPINIFNTPCGWAGNDVEIEVQDGSNCATAGDRICDTPPDYLFAFNDDGLANGCNFIGGIMDRNGDEIDPMENNYMGYFDDCAQYEFTPMQLEEMEDNFLSPNRSYLRTAYVPNEGIVSGTPTFSEPANGSTSSFYDNVFFDWDDIENADNYLLELTSGGGKLTYVLDKSEAILFDLEEGTNYFFTVRAYNETSTCAPKTGVMTFKTGDSSSSVIDIAGLSDFSIAPNPAAGSEVNISFELENAKSIQLNILNVSGQIVSSSASTNFAAGSQKIKQDISGLRSGIYFVQLRTEKGISTSKLIVTK